ncbi:MAG: heme exporter protein CcmB [Pseudomonadota bacterium]
MWRLLKREIMVMWRATGVIFNPLMFLFLAVMLFAVGAPPSTGGGSAVASYGGAILWILVLLTNLLSLDGLFRRDYDNGMIEQMATAPQPLFMLLLMRISAHWIAVGLLLTLLSPLLGVLLGVSVNALVVVFLTLLIGTPALSFLGATGAALTVSFARSGALLGLLILPLYLPTLIFGATAIHDQVNGVDNPAALYWLAVVSILAIGLGPFACAMGLRISLEMQ